MQVYLFTNCLQLKLDPRGKFFGQSNRVEQPGRAAFFANRQNHSLTSVNFRGAFSTIKITSSSIYKLN